MYLNAISKYETGRATHLTLTRVVFEFRSTFNSVKCTYNLTLTRVVFEFGRIKQGLWNLQI